MTRSELIIRLAAHPHFAQLTAKDAELSVKAILEGMSEALAKGRPYRNPRFRELRAELQATAKRAQSNDR
jgi:nucleoid DNA-binding protein